MLSMSKKAIVLHVLEENTAARPFMKIAALHLTEQEKKLTTENSSWLYDTGGKYNVSQN